MIEIDIMTHGKNITFIIDKVPVVTNFTRLTNTATAGA